MRVNSGGPVASPRSVAQTPCRASSARSHLTIGQPGLGRASFEDGCTSSGPPSDLHPPTGRRSACRWQSVSTSFRADSCPRADRPPADDAQHETAQTDVRALTTPKVAHGTVSFPRSRVSRNPVIHSDALEQPDHEHRHCDWNVSQADRNSGEIRGRPFTESGDDQPPCPRVADGRAARLSPHSMSEPAPTRILGQHVDDARRVQRLGLLHEQTRGACLAASWPIADSTDPRPTLPRHRIGAAIGGGDARTLEAQASRARSREEPTAAGRRDGR